HYNLGRALSDSGRQDEALAAYDQAVKLKPDFAEAFTNRGYVLHALRRYDEALASYDRALALKPDDPETLSSRGNTLIELKRISDALASYERALAIAPDHAQAHWNEALARLLIGDYARGWPKYEWRWKCDTFAANPPNFDRPLWLGTEKIAGKTILLHAEQGF